MLLAAPEYISHTMTAMRHKIEIVAQTFCALTFG
jgi:hypothetical protein